MVTGLFIGRFQPLHNGHLAAIREVAAKVERLVVGIGSANEVGTERNPYSADVREKMLRAVVGDLLNVEIARIPDFPQDLEWLEYIEANLPNIDVVFSNNPLVKELFEARGIRVEGVTMLDGISGTKIRELMRNGGDWQGFVPPEVVAILV
jgi:nicotinamide-nucleotide adenylyltransferase